MPPPHSGQTTNNITTQGNLEPFVPNEVLLAVAVERVCGNPVIAADDVVAGGKVFHILHASVFLVLPTVTSHFLLQDTVG